MLLTVSKYNFEVLDMRFFLSCSFNLVFQPHLPGNCSVKVTVQIKILIKTHKIIVSDVDDGSCTKKDVFPLNCSGGFN